MKNIWILENSVCYTASLGVFHTSKQSRLLKKIKWKNPHNYIEKLDLYPVYPKMCDWWPKPTWSTSLPWSITRKEQDWDGSQKKIPKAQRNGLFQLMISHVSRLSYFPKKKIPPRSGLTFWVHEEAASSIRNNLLKRGSWFQGPLRDVMNCTCPMPVSVRTWDIPVLSFLCWLRLCLLFQLSLLIGSNLLAWTSISPFSIVLDWPIQTVIWSHSFRAYSQLRL